MHEDSPAWSPDDMLHIVSNARGGAGNSSGLSKTCRVLPTYTKERHQQALSVGVSQPLSSPSLPILGAWFPVSWQPHGTKWWWSQHSRQSDRKELEDKPMMPLVPLILLSNSPRFTREFTFLPDAAPSCEGRRRNTAHCAPRGGHGWERGSKPPVTCFPKSCEPIA